MLKQEQKNVIFIENEENVMLLRDDEYSTKWVLNNKGSIDDIVHELSKDRLDMYWEKWDYQLFEGVKELYEEMTNYDFFEMFNVTGGMLPIKSYKLETHPDDKQHNDGTTYEIKLIMNLTSLWCPRLDFALYSDSIKVHEYAFKNFNDLNEMADSIRKQREYPYMFEKILFNDFMFSENTCYKFVIHEGQRKIKLQEKEEK